MRRKTAATLSLLMLQSVDAFMSNNSESPKSRSTRSSSLEEKRIAFIRHGCTYMNEYLAVHKLGCPNFTDVFPPSEIDKYQDAKLSLLGQKQAKDLMTSLKDNKADGFASILSDLDLIVVSPLTRAIQTFELGIQPVLSDRTATPPIVALPLASERVYLISDIGRPRTALQSDYAYIDFESAFVGNNDGNDFVENWWFTLDDACNDNKKRQGVVTSETYEEWRPSDQNQQYACPGEPDDAFEQRMRRLYMWLRDRPETTIAVVCHFGVIEWMLNRGFRNCEVQVVPFSEIRPLTMENDEVML